MKKIYLVLFFLIILFGIGIRLYSLDKDYMAEEPDFIRAALALKNTGSPVIYESEQWPSMTALWHPPMYIFILSMLFRFGESEIIARSVNFLFSLFTGLLIYLFCVSFFERGKKIGLIALSIWLINYYIFSSTIQIDIDMSSALFTFAFVFATMMFYKTKGIGYFVISCISLLFAISNRYPIAFLTFVSLGIYLWSKKMTKRDKWLYVSTGIISGAVFFAIWTIYSTIIEPGNFFSFLLHNAELGAEQVLNLKVYVASFILNISQLIRLMTLPFVLLILLSYGYFIFNRNKYTNVLLVYSLTIFTFFLFLPRPAFGYPRYFLSAMPAFCVLVSCFVDKNMENVDKKKIFVGFVAGFVCLLLLLLFNPQGTFYSGDGLIKATNLPDFVFNLLCSLPLILFLLSRKEKRKLLVVLLLSLFIVQNVYFDLKSAKYEPYTEETGEYVKSVTTENDVILASKAVSFYADRKFYLNDNNKPKIDFSASHLKEYFSKSYSDREMKSDFFWPSGFYNSFYYNETIKFTDLEKAKYAVIYHPLENEVYEKRFGDFYVYEIDNV